LATGPLVFVACTETQRRGAPARSIRCRNPRAAAPLRAGVAG